MKLYLVHCGFYDTELLEGVFEQHVNLFVAAESFEDARVQAKLHPDFTGKKMHVDGMQEVEAVSGFRVGLERDAGLNGASVLHSSRHRDLPQNQQKYRF